MTNKKLYVIIYNVKRETEGQNKNLKEVLKMKEQCYLSTIEHTTENHRSHFIIHCGQWYFAEFKTQQQFDFFAQTVGLWLTTVIERRYISTSPEGEQNNLYQRSELNIKYIDECLFWNKSEIPDDVKPIKALSNGSIVTCYFKNDGETLFFYRPNPNAPRSIYNPLELEQHIVHKQIYGSY